MAGLTINQLLEECEKAKSKGFGNKKILISRDDEGNGFHTLFYGFLLDKKEIQEYKDMGLFQDDNEVEDVVLLG